jgi:hypothetical protein
VNEYLWKVFDADPAQRTAFVCECGDPTCTRTAMLTFEQYAERRPGLIILHAVHDPSQPAKVRRPGGRPAPSSGGAPA